MEEGRVAERGRVEASASSRRSRHPLQKVRRSIGNTSTARMELENLEGAGLVVGYWQYRTCAFLTSNSEKEVHELTNKEVWGRRNVAC